MDRSAELPGRLRVLNDTSYLGRNIFQVRIEDVRNAQKLEATYNAYLNWIIVANFEQFVHKTSLQMKELWSFVAFLPGTSLGCTKLCKFLLSPKLSGQCGTATHVVLYNHFIYTSIITYSPLHLDPTSRIFEKVQPYSPPPQIKRSAARVRYTPERPCQPGYATFYLGGGVFGTRWQAFLRWESRAETLLKSYSICIFISEMVTMLFW